MWTYRSFSVHDDNVLCGWRTELSLFFFFNSHSVLRWKLSAMTGEEFSVLLGIVNDAQGSIGNKPSIQSLRLNYSGSSVNMSESDHGHRHQHLHLT